MKKFACAFFCFCLMFLLAGCGAHSSELALIMPQSAAPYPLPDQNNLQSQLEKAGFAVHTYLANDQEDPLSLMQQAGQDGCQLFLVGLNDPQQAAGLVEEAKKHNQCLLLFGAKPQDSVLGDYDKAWYLGANLEKEGELLGEGLTHFWKSGAIADLNADHQLQAVILGYDETDPRPDAALRVLENYGIYHTVCARNTVTDPADSAAVRTLLEPFVGQAELILCADPLLAQAVCQAAAELSLSAPVACFGAQGYSDEQLSQMPVLVASRWQDGQACQLLVHWADNAAHARPITSGTDLFLDGNLSAYVGFTLYPSDLLLTEPDDSLVSPQSASA
ncbi:MAG: substrate-binding domain-containing protein [Pygmaiobacter massiliensis]|nr:substrate-binding domain-containing protein [Pygmaiobacter massiliensis]